VDRRDIGSWLSTPGQAAETYGGEQDYRGQRLGLPQSGTGSIPNVGRRVLALLLDWFAAILVTLLLFPGLTYGDSDFSLVVLAVFAAEVWLLTWLTGSSFGQRILRLQVTGVDGNQLRAIPAAIRTALICLVIPPLVWDRDTRGLQDKAAKSACVMR
jgi:hypothetical protein